MPFGVQYPAGAGQDEEDPQARMIQDLIASLETAPAPTAPPAGAPPPTALQDALFGGTPRHFAGALGDAIAAMAAVKAGGAPPAMGAFAASQQRQAEERQRQMEEYQKRQEENAGAERMLRNQARISTFQQSQKIAGDQAEAAIKAKNARALRFVPTTIEEGGQRRRVVDVYDASSGEHVGRQDQGVAPNPPQGYTLGYDQDGNAMWFKKPSGEGPSEPAKPVVNEAGHQVKKTPAASMQGIQQQLDNTSTLLEEMKGNYRQRPSSTTKQAIGTAGANLLSRGVGAEMGLSGLASKIDKHAVIHERDREALATTLAFPLTGSRRSVEGARKSLLDIIPHYTDPPEVWDVFDKQMQALITNARKMPWGESPSTAQENYGSLLEGLAGGSAGAAPKTADPAVQEYQQFLEKLKKEQGLAPTTP